jgi:hypothetical protein
MTISDELSRTVEEVCSRAFPGSAANLLARLESLAYEVFRHPARLAEIGDLSPDSRGDHRCLGLGEHGTL